MDQNDGQWRRLSQEKTLERQNAARSKMTLPLAKLSQDIDLLMNSVRKAKQAGYNISPSVLKKRKAAAEWQGQRLHRRTSSYVKVNMKEALETVTQKTPAWIVRSIRRHQTKMALATPKEPLFLPSISNKQSENHTPLLEGPTRDTPSPAREPTHLRVKSDAEVGRRHRAEDIRLLRSEFESDKHEYEKNFYTVLGADSVSRFKLHQL